VTNRGQLENCSTAGRTLMKLLRQPGERHRMSRHRGWYVARPSSGGKICCSVNLPLGPVVPRPAAGPLCYALMDVEFVKPQHTSDFRMGYRLYPGDRCPKCGEHLTHYPRSVWTLFLRPSFLRCSSCGFTAQRRSGPSSNDRHEGVKQRARHGQAHGQDRQ